MRFNLSWTRTGLFFTLIFPTAVPVAAAWRIDPDFRPLPTFGYALPAIAAIQSDGRLIVRGGAARLLTDGAVDPSYHAGVEYDRVLISPTGQLIAGTRPLVWLNADGSPTGVTVESQVEGDIAADRDVGMRVAGFRPDGSFIVFGDFVALNGVPRPGIARILADGTVDPAFVPPDIGAAVSPGDPPEVEWANSRAALQSDGRVVLLLSFLQRDNMLLRLNTDGSLDPGFESGPGGFDGDNLALAIDGADRILCSREAFFANIWRHDANGGNPVAFPSDYGIYELRRVPDGTIVVIDSDGIGRLQEDGSVERLDLPVEADGDTFVPMFLAFTDDFIHLQSNFGVYLRLSPDGRVDPGLVLPGATPAPGSVSRIAPTVDGKVVIAGRFTHVNDVPRHGAARLLPDGSLDPTFAPDGEFLRETIAALAVQPDGRVLIGGEFSITMPETRHHLARLNPDGSLDTSFDAALPAEAAVTSMIREPGGMILVGGYFPATGGSPEAAIVRLLPTGARDPSFQDGSGVVRGNTTTIGQIARASDGRIVATYYAYAGAPEFHRLGVVRLKPDGTLDTPFDPPDLGPEGLTMVAWVASLGTDGSVAVGAYSPMGLPALMSLEADGTPRFMRSVPGWIFHVVHDGAALITSTAYRGRGAIRRFDAAGDPDDTLDLDLGANGSAGDLVWEPDGSLLVAGGFSEVDGMAYHGAFRMVPDVATPRLANMSTRGYVGDADGVLIAGFYVGGDEPQRVLIRGVAESLAGSGLGGLATDVRLAVYRNGESDPWREADTWLDPATDDDSYHSQRTGDRVGAFPLDIGLLPGGGMGSADAAVSLDLAPGGYTVHLHAATPGIGLIEIYDGSGIAANRRLVNLSTRGRVGTGDEKLIGGFVVATGTERVLIRAVGPGIADRVSGTLADPLIELVRQSDHATIATNDNWSDNANAAAIAAASRQVSGLQLEAGSADAALLVELPAGAYTVLVSGVGDTSGIALVEAYEVE